MAIGIHEIRLLQSHR